MTFIKYPLLVLGLPLVLPPVRPHHDLPPVGVLPMPYLWKPRDLGRVPATPLFCAFYTLIRLWNTFMLCARILSFKVSIIASLFWKSPADSIIL